MNTTRICLPELLLHATLGVHAWEQATPRPLRLSLELELAPAAFTAAAATDDLHHTLDYAMLEQELVTLLAVRPYKLIETLCATIADHVLKDAKVCAVRVQLTKPGALRFAPAVMMVHEARR